MLKVITKHKCIFTDPAHVIEGFGPIFVFDIKANCKDYCL